MSFLPPPQKMHYFGPVDIFQGPSCSATWEAFWQFAVLEWHPWHWRLNASSLTMAAAMVVSILSLLAGLGLVAFGKPVEVRCSGSVRLEGSSQVILSDC